MDIKCKTNELVKGLQTIQSVISSKTTVPSLSNVLIETENNTLSLIATDLEIGIRKKIPASITKKGATTLPAKKLYEIIRSLPTEEVQFVMKEADHMEIKSGRSVFKMVGIKKEEFPVFPDIKPEKSFSIKSNTLKKMITLTNFSVSTDPTRYVLCGIHMVVEKGKIKMISTDGRRLSYVEKEGLSDKKKEIGVIIPIKAVNELNKILPETEADIKIEIEKNQILFRVNGTILISRLIDGNFPNYEQVIPKEVKTQLVLNRDEFLQATQRIATITTEKSVAVRYTLKKDKLIISAESPGIGEAMDEMDIDYSAESMVIAYNPTFVLDVLKNLKGNQIIWELTSSLNPAVIRPSQEKQTFFVIMPMRV